MRSEDTPSSVLIALASMAMANGFGDWSSGQCCKRQGHVTYRAPKAKKRKRKASQAAKRRNRQ